MERINSFQHIVDRWENGVLPEEGRTPNERYSRSVEEITEFLEEHQKYTEGESNDRNVAMEAIDVIITLTGYINSLGYDMENLLHDKLEIIHRKYNPVVNQQLRNNGMHWKDAIDHQKESWKNTL